MATLNWFWGVVDRWTGGQVDRWTGADKRLRANALLKDLRKAGKKPLIRLKLFISFDLLACQARCCFKKYIQS